MISCGCHFDEDGLDPDDEFDDTDSESLYLKFCFDGAATIARLSERLKALASDLDRRGGDGWELERPIESGWAHLRRSPIDT